MADSDALLRGLLDGVAVRPPSSFVWFGVSTRATPGDLGTGLGPAALRSHLEEALAAALYGGFYQRGSAGPVAADGPRRPDPPFVRALSRANAGTGCADPGWRVAASGARGTLVTKRGLAFSLPRSARRGSAATIILPKELLRIAPGFYTAVGNRMLDSRARLARVYWNIEAAGAVPLIATATLLLNERGIPFRLKVVDHPGGFRRCDAGVLYVRRRDCATVWPLLGALRDRLRRHLRVDVPAFTKALAPGVGVADAPPGGESFGMARCRLVAAALVRAAAREARGAEERLLEIRNAFAAHGLDPDRPFLGPRARDVYPPLVP